MVVDDNRKSYVSIRVDKKTTEEKIMALTWDITNVDLPQEILYEKNDEGEEHLNPITWAIIWSTIFLGFNELTEKNLNDWHRRMKQIVRQVNLATDELVKKEKADLEEVEKAVEDVDENATVSFEDESELNG